MFCESRAVPSFISRLCVQLVQFANMAMDTDTESNPNVRTVLLHDVERLRSEIRRHEDENMALSLVIQGGQDLPKRGLMRFRLHNNEYVLELAKIDCRFAPRSYNNKSGLWDKETRKHLEMANETLKKIVAPEH